MRSSLFVTAVILATFSCPTAIVLGQVNLLTNGDFEIDPESTVAGGTNVIDVGTLTGWRVFAVGDAEQTATVTEAAGRTGKGVDLVRTDFFGLDAAMDLDTPALRIPIPAEQRVYKFTVDARDGAMFGGSDFLGVQLQWADHFQNSSVSFDPGANFETFGLADLSDGGATVSGRLWLAHGNWSAHLDNAVIVDATTGVNRLVNGGFENSDDRLLNWRFIDTTGFSGTATLSTDANSGQHAALLEVTEDPLGDVVLDVFPTFVPTIGGENLNLSFAAQTVVAPFLETALLVNIGGYDSAGNFVDELLRELVFPSEDNYVTYDLEFDVPEGVAGVNIGFRVFDSLFNTPSMGSYLIDDVSISRDAEGHPADHDGDFDVDGHDFLHIQREYGTSTGADDLAAWAAAFGTQIPQATSIPEPSAAALALATLAAGLARRRPPHATVLRSVCPYAP